MNKVPEKEIIETVILINGMIPNVGSIDYKSQKQEIEAGQAELLKNLLPWTIDLLNLFNMPFPPVYLLRWLNLQLQFSSSRHFLSTVLELLIYYNTTNFLLMCTNLSDQYNDFIFVKIMNSY